LAKMAAAAAEKVRGFCADTVILAPSSIASCVLPSPALGAGLTLILCGPAYSITHVTGK
jgi:hypothetical protein